MDRIQLSDVQSDMKLADVKLSSNYLSADKIVGTFNKVIDNAVDLQSDQDVGGCKAFSDGIEIGQANENISNNCPVVGNNLTCGSYNFFYEGVDVYDNKTGVFWLCGKQPRYPYPFVCYNGDRSKFKIMTRIVDANDTTTYANLSAGSALQKIWQCSPNGKMRADYNQLSIDLGPDYWKEYDETKIQERLTAYLADAFSADEEIELYLSGKDLVGRQITFVNCDKIQYLRGATVLSVIEDGGALSVKFEDKALGIAGRWNGLSNYGAYGFYDYDYDDQSLVLIDSPTLSGPANTSTYSSLNVGTVNTVVRRCSMAVGKNNRSEADFAIALGRRANAQGYATFVWAPARNTYSVGETGTFTIGVNAANLAIAHQSGFTGDIYMAANNSTHDAAHEEWLYKYVWGCISSDSSLKDEFKKWLGLS